MKAYLFTGEVQDIGKFRDFDEAFLESINTFRPVTSREIVGKTPQKIHYIQATSETTFEALAESMNLGKREAEDLRMINGYYPSGEPKPGEWIRIFKR
jgi:predicted Zn-dependent protease